MNAAFVTGGAGFVGSGVVRGLLGAGWDVHLLLHDRSSWRLEELGGRVRIHPGDVLDAGSVLRAVRTSKPRVAYHLAAYGAYSEQADGPRILSTNILGAWNVMSACAAEGCALLVNAGSSSEYGLKSGAPLESETLQPNSVYSVSKAAATHLGAFLSRPDGLRIVTLRLYSVYGPFEEPTRLIPTLIRRALANEPLLLVDPETGRDFVHIDDVVRAFLLVDRLMEQGGEVFNIGSGIQSTVREAVACVLEATGSSSETRWNAMPPRAWDTRCWVADAAKARERLGWVPQIPLREGIRRTVEWQKSNAAPR